MIHNDTIVAPATPSGGAIAIVRLEGERAIEIADSLVRTSSGKRVAEMEGNRLTHAEIYDHTRRIDDVVVSLFRAPHSYTGGDMVEIACHGSAFIVSEITRLAIEQGARTATAGEFTKRAFLAGKLDLSQAEAVADVIAAEERAALTLADTQLRGGYSASLASLRGELVHLASLLELELDFSEEDVEFADRKRLVALLDGTASEIARLAASFATGNAIKRGIAVAIVGKPNVGKSTLLNRIVGDERAMVSDIAGTTRDTIEESVRIDGVVFRFVDTAGVHTTEDQLERLGIERTHKALREAQIVIELFDAVGDDIVEVQEGQHLLRVLNKCDLTPDIALPEGWIAISARYGEGVDELLRKLRASIDTESVMRGETVISSTRHYEALVRANEALVRTRNGLTSGLPTDLVAQDLREVLSSIGEITGEVTSTDLLSEIFSKFCIGK